jgi:hypothetical protein
MQLPGTNAERDAFYVSPEYTMGEFDFDVQESVKRLIRYLLEGIAVSLAAHLVGKNKLDIQTIVLLGVTASAVLSILDVFSPTIGSATRSGAGLGLGAGISGFRALTI